jgi:hypothetical protein
LVRERTRRRIVDDPALLKVAESAAALRDAATELTTGAEGQRRTDAAMNVLTRQEQEQGIPIGEDVDLLAQTQAQVAMGELFPMIRALGEAEAEALAGGRSRRWISRAKKKAVLGH